MENYFGELTRAYGQKEKYKNEQFVQSIYIDMIIQESILMEQKRRLKAEIDAAIDCDDSANFYQLSGKLQQIEKQLNA